MSRFAPKSWCAPPPQPRPGVDGAVSCGTEEPMARRSSLAGEFWRFMMTHKAYWMAPILIVLAVLVALVIAGGTGAAPFIYTLF